MKNILIVYASRYGQTQKIAEKMKAGFIEQGAHAKTADVARMSDVSLDKYDSIVLGTPIYAVRTDRKLRNWISRHREVLAKKETGFYMVCLNAADKSPQAREAEREILRKMFRETHWTPRFVAVFAGALNYKEYNFFYKWIMKRISQAKGAPTDTSRDYEFTDWHNVRSFTRVFLEGNPHHAFDTLERIGKKENLDQLMTTPV